MSPILIFVLLLLAFATLAYFALNYLLPSYLQKANEGKAKSANLSETDPLLANLDPNLPALVYFTSDDCVPCKITQRPAIDKLQALMPDLQIITVNAPESLDVVERWGVMSVPRTFIIGRERKVYATNMDLTLTDTLKAQFDTALAASPNEPMQFHEGVKTDSQGFKISFKSAKR